MSGRWTIACVLLCVSCAGPARWYKGNLHTHSLWSDGNDFPEVIARWYKERGYDFLSLSDHNILADHEKWMEVDEVVRRGGRRGVQRYREQFGRDWVQVRETDGKQLVRLRQLDEWRGLLEEPGSFCILTAEEITDRFERLPIHINATNVQELIAPQGGNSVQEVMRNNLQAVEAQQARTGEPVVAHLNHPNFGYAVTAEDMAAVVEERFFEVFNGHPDTRHHGDHVHASVDRLWDIANTLRITKYGGEPLYGLATDDCHNYHNATGSTPGRGWVMVQAEELSPAAICRALQAGRFYSSTGVMLRSVGYDGSRLRVVVDAEPGVSYRTRFIGTRRGAPLDGTPVRNEAGDVVAGVTLRYDDSVGAVLAVVDGDEACYEMRGDEYYVRAVVTADRAVDNPVYDGQRAQAWTQPVRPR